MSNNYLEIVLLESDADTVGLPEGVTFISDERGARIDQLVNTISNIFRAQGYMKVIPPIFEYYETFDKGSGHNIARKTFSFKDKDGKLLSLRYDMTTPIARMVAMKYTEHDLPLKYYYVGDVFREQPIYAGKPRQLRQVGVELIGDDDISADIEVLNLLGESLSVLHKDYKIVLGDIRLYKHILSQLKLGETKIEALNNAFIHKDTTSIELILREVEGIAFYKDILLRLPYLVGELDKISKSLTGLGDMDFTIYTERITQIIAKVNKSIRKNIIVDMGLIKDFGYYTSTTIEGYIPAIGYPIANGGRYDKLFSEFGRDFPSIGFAVDISFCY